MERARKQYPVQLEEDVIARIDKLAEKCDLNRSQMMRNMLLVGLEEAEALNRTGILTVVKIARGVKEKFVTDIVEGKLGLNKRGEWEIKKM